jgi:hypothetical protein
MSGQPKGRKISFIRTGGDRETFRVTLHERTGESWFEADVDEVISWEMDGTPAEFEPYLSCVIKWDSCSHFHFGGLADHGQRDGYLHLCGVQDFRKHVTLLRELYALAFEVMGREPEPDETWGDG